MNTFGIHRHRPFPIAAVGAGFLFVAAFSSLAAESFRPVKARVAYPEDRNSTQPELRSLSADGTVAVGAGYSGRATGFRWSNGVLTFLQPLSGGTGSAANAVSANGSVVVGSSSGSGGRAVRWIGSAASALNLPAPWTSSSATLVSSDGSVIAGTLSRSLDGVALTQPFRWTSAAGTVPLAVPPGVTSVRLCGLSGDGMVVLGACFIPSISGDGSEVFCRWTAGGSPELLEIPSGWSAYALNALSASGNAAVGTLTAGSLYSACRWNGTVAELLPPPSAGASTFGADVSADGSVVVGTGAGVLRWTSAGVENLGNFSSPRVSPDGAVVAGTRSNSPAILRPDEVIVWEAQNGARSLTGLLLERFKDPIVARYQRFKLAAVRNVGGVITLAGTANDPERIADGWVATLPLAGGAEPDPFAGSLFEKTASFTPTATLRETYSDSLATVSVPAEPDLPGFSYSEKRVRFSTDFSATVSMEGVDPATLDASTPVQLILGCFDFAGKLSDDPGFAPGKTSATLALPGGGALKVAWNAKTLSVAVHFAITENANTVGNFSRVRATAFAVPTFVSGDFLNTRPSSYAEVALRIGARAGRRSALIEGARDGRSVVSFEERFDLVEASVKARFDVVPPKLTFLQPAEKLSFSVLPYGGGVPVSLRFSDDSVPPRTFAFGLGKIFLKVNDGPFVELPFYGADTYSVASPIPGVNTLQAKAVDASGNESALVTRTFVFESKGGAYAGLAWGEDDLPRGTIAFFLNGGGVFTGTTKVDGKSLKFRGILAPDGTAEVVAGTGTAAVTLRFSIAFDGLGNAITGSVERGGTMLGRVGGGRAPYNGRSTFAPQGGTYTMLLPSATEVATAPPGSGYAKVTVSGKGVSRLVGKLADGTAFSAGGVVDGRGVLPIFVRLYSTGLLGGELLFRDHAGLSDFDGTLHWVKPPQKKGFYGAGFSTSLAAIGSSTYYTPTSTTIADFFQPIDPSSQANARLKFSGGNLAGIVEQSIIATAPVFGKAPFQSLGPLVLAATKPAPVKFSLKTTKDGLLSGAFLDPAANKTRKFQGVLLRKTASSGGFFLGADAGGKFELQPGFQ